MDADTGRDAGLAVAPHIRLCPIDDQLIVLDLLNNRYSGVAGATSAALRGFLRRPSPDQPHAWAPLSSEAAALIDPLLARGWLVRTAAAFTPPSTDVQFSEAAETLLPRRSGEGHVGGPVRAVRCLDSAISASWRLRHRSLFAIAEAVTRRANKRPLPGAESSRDELVDAVSAYLRFRPLLFSARDRCLHDSLTLVTFLAAERISAQWVIGVRVRPFAAHSWVQHGGLVLNDQHERVRSYRPIFVA